MTSPLRQADRRHAWLAITLMLSLLFAQWLGFRHAIAHGNSLPAFSQSASKTGSLQDHQKSSGICAALDAAALGCAVPMANFSPALAVGAEGPVALPLRTGWHRLFTAHFSSRAPPLNA